MKNIEDLENMEETEETEEIEEAEENKNKKSKKEEFKMRMKRGDFGSGKNLERIKEIYKGVL